MARRMSKSEAVKLIVQAMKEGWKRSVSATRLGVGRRPFYVQVSVSKVLQFANGYINKSAHIIIGFHLRKRMSISVKTFTDYDTKGKEGPWHALYVLNQMKAV